MKDETEMIDVDDNLPVATEIKSIGAVIGKVGHKIEAWGLLSTTCCDVGEDDGVVHIPCGRH